MELHEGIYENLITKEIQTDIEKTKNDGLICKEDNIDSAESPSMLAVHLGRIISYFDVNIKNMIHSNSIVYLTFVKN